MGHCCLHLLSCSISLSARMLDGFRVKFKFEMGSTEIEITFTSCDLCHSGFIEKNLEFIRKKFQLFLDKLNSSPWKYVGFIQNSFWVPFKLILFLESLFMYLIYTLPNVVLMTKEKFAILLAFWTCLLAAASTVVRKLKRKKEKEE